MRRITARHETWPLKQAFTISRGTKTSADVVTVTITDENVSGRGECVPYAHYGESIDSVIAQIQKLENALAAGMSRDELLEVLPRGAARNAVDCALWDIESKQSGRRAWELAGVAPPGPATTAYTLSLDTPEAMAAAARANAHRPLLKLKLGSDQTLQRVQAVRTAAPDAQLIVDANEAWRPADLQNWLPALAELRVALVEQPLPAADDAALATIEHVVPIGADESCHGSSDLMELKDRYDVANIKLDKCGGLTAALQMKQMALDEGFVVMVGCMVGTSLAMAPAMLLTAGARFVDLDGPLLLAADRRPPLEYRGVKVAPPRAELWG